MKIFFLLTLLILSPIIAFAQNADSEKIKKLDVLMGKLKTQNELLKQDATPTDQDDEKIIAELQAKYAICKNKYIPKGPEVDDMLHMAAFKGTAEEKEKLYLANIAKYPDSPNMLTSYIRNLLFERNLQQAYIYLTKALQQFPNNPKVRFYLDQYEFVRTNPQMDKTNLQMNLGKAGINYNSADISCHK
jgi:hypothetical protein